VESLGEVVSLVIGIAVLIVIGIPLLAFALTAGLTIVALQIAVVAAILGYIIGIPWSILFRLRHGR